MALGLALLALVVFSTILPLTTTNVLGVTINFNLGNGEERALHDNLMQYEVENFNMTGYTSLCPKGSECTYDLDNAEFRENSASYAYVLEGTLKVSSDLGGGASETRNYDLWGSMDRYRTVQNGSSVVESMSGDISIDSEQASLNFNPEHTMYAIGTVTMGGADIVESNDGDEDEDEDEEDEDSGSSGDGDGTVEIIGLL